MANFSKTQTNWHNKWATVTKPHPPNPSSLIRVFAVHLKKVWVLSFPLSPQQRLWSDWANAQADPSLRWAHSHFVGFVMSRLKYCTTAAVVVSVATHLPTKISFLWFSLAFFTLVTWCNKTNDTLIYYVTDPTVFTQKAVEVENTENNVFPQ